VKKGLAQRVGVAQGKIEGKADDGKTTLFYYAGQEYIVNTDQWDPDLQSLQSGNRQRARQCRRYRRPCHSRYGAS
jgi:hypothetical protein